MLATAPRFFSRHDQSIFIVFHQFYLSIVLQRQGFLKVVADQMEKVFETDRNKLHTNLRLRNVDGYGNWFLYNFGFCISIHIHLLGLNLAFTNALGLHLHLQLHDVLYPI
jgi:hypothetical protein